MMLASLLRDKKLLLAAAALVFSPALALGLQALAAPLPVDHMVVIGDSLSDNGNYYSVAGYLAPPLYTVGRATDGPDTYPASAIYGVWVGQLAISLGLPAPTPYLPGHTGTNFAFTGAETGADTNSAGQNGMDVQLQEYLATRPANIATALHLFWGGTNDVLDYPGLAVLAEQNAVARISAQIGAIAAAGGRYFVWLDLPPLDRTPRARGNGLIRNASSYFGADQQAAISRLQAAYPGITIIPVDVYSLYNDAIDNPAKYGLVNATDPAQGQPVNPDQYLFWDSLHPTTRMHRIIATAARAAIVNTLTPVAAVGAAVSDDFSSPTLNTAVWKITAGGTVTVANHHALLSLPPAGNHDIYVGGNTAVRMLQPVANGNLDVAARFDTTFAGPWQGQGILVQQDANTYLRFETYSDGTHVGLFSAIVANGTQTPFIYTPVSAAAPGSIWLRVQRSANTWTLSSSSDGVTYTPAGTFNQPLVVSSVGPYAWTYNANEAAAQPLTSAVGAFYNLAAH